MRRKRVGLRDRGGAGCDEQCAAVDAVRRPSGQRLACGGMAVSAQYCELKAGQVRPVIISVVIRYDRPTEEELSKSEKLF